jgi:hypothetical protein
MGSVAASHARHSRGWRVAGPPPVSMDWPVICAAPARVGSRRGLRADRAVDLFASRAGEGFGSFYTLARDAMR